MVSTQATGKLMLKPTDLPGVTTTDELICIFGIEFNAHERGDRLEMKFG